MREAIVKQIKQAAVSSRKIQVAVVPSKARSTPIAAHSFIDNEQAVIELTSTWLNQVAA